MKLLIALLAALVSLCLALPAPTATAPRNIEDQDTSTTKQEVRRGDPSTLSPGHSNDNEFDFAGKQSPRGTPSTEKVPPPKPKPKHTDNWDDKPTLHEWWSSKPEPKPMEKWDEKPTLHEWSSRPPRSDPSTLSPRNSDDDDYNSAHKQSPRGTPLTEKVPPPKPKPKHTDNWDEKPAHYEFWSSRPPRSDPSTLSPRTPPTIEHKPGTPYLEWFDEEDTGGAPAVPTSGVTRKRRYSENENANGAENLEDWIEVINDTPTPV